jgi:hypothetical protein
MPLNQKKFKFFLFFLIIATHLSFSYYAFGGWWNSSIGTALIILLSRLLWKENAWAMTGLKMSAQVFSWSLLLSVILIFPSLSIVKKVGENLGIEIWFTHYTWYFHDVFYTLNEEMILGAILLNLLTKQMKFHQLTTSLGVAMIFSLLHFAFYRWIFADRGLIHPLTLISLFLIGFCRNNLIINFGHIGFAWALHFSWMAVMFGSEHFYVDTGRTLSEVERFNLYLGSHEMVFISAVLAILSVFRCGHDASSQVSNT